MQIGNLSSYKAISSEVWRKHEYIHITLLLPLLTTSNDRLLFEKTCRSLFLSSYFSGNNIKLLLSPILVNTGVNFILIFWSSLITFSLQDPQPTRITPQSGPQAGGTTLTITGMNLATGSKKDVHVFLGSQPCNV